MRRIGLYITSPMLVIGAAVLFGGVMACNDDVADLGAFLAAFGIVTQLIIGIIEDKFIKK